MLMFPVGGLPVISAVGVFLGVALRLADRVLGEVSEELPPRRKASTR